MPEFIYKAKKGPSETVEGVISADNISSAIRKASEGGLYLLSVDEYHTGRHAPGSLFTVSGRKVSVKELANFTRQLSDLLGSGITIARALGLLYEQTENRAFKAVIADVRDSCVAGNLLSESLAKYPAVFSKLYTSLIKSGEASGTIDDILRRLADFSDKDLEIRTKVRSALAYPILMAAVGVMTVAVLLTFVIPKIAGMFSDLGQNLPAPTLLLINISSALRNYWWLIMLLALLAGAALKNAYKKKEIKRLIDAAKLKMPLAGDLVKRVEVARFARTLATLLKNGVPILEALTIVSGTINNDIIKDEIMRASSRVREGLSLAGGFGKESVLPRLVVNMIEVGEESGKVDDVLFKVAENYDKEVDAAIKVMMSLLEPILILALGLIVGFIVVSMLLPIFEINFLAK